MSPARTPIARTGTVRFLSVSPYCANITEQGEIVLSDDLECGIPCPPGRKKPARWRGVTRYGLVIVQPRLLYVQKPLYVLLIP